MSQIAEAVTITASEEEMSFIRAVCESPDDDAPRLIFADFLDENGKSSYFIRKQVTNRHKDNCVPGSRFYSQFGDVLRQEFGVHWEKGFLEVVKCTAEWWLENAPKLTIFHPIRRVTFMTPPEVEQAFDGEFLICYFRKGVNRSVVVRSNDVGEQLDDLLEENWPDIEFTM